MGRQGVVVFLTCLGFCLSSCTVARSTATIVPPLPTATKAQALTAQAYLNDTLDYIQANALLRDSVNWPMVRREALALAQDAQATADTYRAIRFVLLQLNDRHSNLLDPETARRLSSVPDVALPQGQRFEEKFGYLTVPSFRGGAEPATRYIASGQQQIQSLDGAGTCGWVLDLRRNDGGNMWPMLATIGPLLGEGEVGAFINSSGERVPWSYREGQALLNGEVLASGPTLPLRSPMPPIAILTDRYTASSGEAITIAFRGRPATRSFGEGTAGVPSANVVKTLSAGAQLLLTVFRDTDRTGRVYGHNESIAPDESVEGYFTYAEDPKRDKVLPAALAWLRQQPGCAR
jgi:C-terminal processing protease CtpA/Prc